MTDLARALGERRCASSECDGGTCTLADLGKACPARIVGCTDDDAVCRRLFDLGFAPGQTAELVRSAPMRDPLMFTVGGCEIVLRKAEARRILVQVP